MINFTLFSQKTIKLISFVEISMNKIIKLSKKKLRVSKTLHIQTYFISLSFLKNLSVSLSKAEIYFRVQKTKKNKIIQCSKRSE